MGQLFLSHWIEQVHLTWLHFGWRAFLLATRVDDIDCSIDVQFSCQCSVNFWIIGQIVQIVVNISLPWRLHSLSKVLLRLHVHGHIIIDSSSLTWTSCALVSIDSLLNLLIEERSASYVEEVSSALSDLTFLQRVEVLLLSSQILSIFRSVHLLTSIMFFICSWLSHF